MSHARRSLRNTKTKDSGKVKQEEWLTVLSSAPKGQNTQGLPTLPDELLDQILSYFPPAPLNFPYTKADDGPETQKYIATRKATLYSLTHLCSNLRRFFWPYVWERIEVCHGMLVGNPPIRLERRSMKREVKKAYATELVRQLEIVTIRDPSLARFVKILNIEVTDFSVHPVLLELGRCMALFPNLQSVKIRTEGSFLNFPETPAQRAFRDYVYPQISVAILSESFWPLLNSCPKIRAFQGIAGTNERLLPYLTETPCISRIFGLFPNNILKFVAEKLPNLKEISIEVTPISFYSSDLQLPFIIEAARHFRHLDVLVFETSQSSSSWHGLGRYNPEVDFQRCTLFAGTVFKALMETSPSPPQRVSIKLYTDGILDSKHHKTFSSQDLVLPV